MYLELERISEEEVGVNTTSRPIQHTTGSLEMSRRECTGVPDETAQHNFGKREDAGGVERQRSDTNFQG